MRTLIGIARPEKFFAPWEFVESLLSLKGEYEIATSNGSLIEENRNELFNKALGYDCLLMVDTDMVFTKNHVDALVHHIEKGTADIACGLFLTGHPPHWPALYHHLSPAQKVIEIKELKEVAGCGMAFTAISKKVLLGMGDRPFDRIVVDGKLFGEDLSFCYKAGEKGFKIICDPTIKIGHLRSQVI